MDRTVSALIIGLLGVWFWWGCQAPPPPRVPVPSQHDRTARSEEMRPLPPPSYDDPTLAPPFDDVPLVTQRPPEQRAYVDAYRRVGSPRITLFVNRTLEGNIIPVNPADQLVSVERTRSTRGDVTIERSESGRRYDRTDRFESSGPGEVRDSVDVYLRPGQYDEIKAREIDYGAIETIMTDWLAANGQVTIISPTMARQRLSDTQVKELQEGRPQVLREIAQQLDADVLVQVQARPTRQTPDGLQVRILAEAINTHGGESVGRAVVDVPPPLDKPQINDYTRYLARKLMDDVTGTWNAALVTPAPARAPATAPSE